MKKTLFLISILLFLTFTFTHSQKIESPSFDDIQSEQSSNSLESSNQNQASKNNKQSNTQTQTKFYKTSSLGQAIIIRAGKLAIPPSAQLIVNKLKDSFSGIPSTQDTLSNFSKKYLVDLEATTQTLKAMGYSVKNLFSSDYNTGSSYKNAVKESIKDDNTKLIIFYGHGDTGNGVALYYPSEYSFEDPTQFEEINKSSGDQHADLSADDLKKWLGDKKLKALILMSCNGAYQTYLSKHKVLNKSASSYFRWDQVVEKGGFFAGWATYSLYFNPKTPKILHSLQRHIKSGSKTTKYYYIRTGSFLRKISVMAGLDDGDKYWNHLKNDKSVRVHDEKVDGLVDNLIDLASNLQDKNKNIHNSMKNFLISHQKFLDDNDITNTNSDGSYAKLPSNPSTKDLNSYINANSDSVAKIALQALAPDLITPKHFKLYLDESNPNSIRLDADLKVSRGKSLQNILSFLGDQTKGVKGLDSDKLKDNIKTIHKSFPEINLQIDATLERNFKNNKIGVQPTIHGYQLFLGKTPIQKPVKTSDFEIHLNVKDLNKLFKQAIEKQFSKEEKIFSNSWTLNYLLGKKTFSIEGYIGLQSFDGLNNHWRNKDTLDLSAKWRLKIDWPLLGKRYAYATTKIFLKREMMKETNSVRVTPEIQLVLGDGWAPQVPEVSWLPTKIVNSFFSKVTKWVIGKGVAKTFDFLEHKLNKIIQEKAGPYMPKDPHAKQKFDQMVKVYNRFLPKYMSKETLEKIRKDSAQQKFYILSTKSSGDTITAKCSGIILNLGELIPGLNKKDMIQAIRVKNIKSTKSTLSIYTDFKQ
ncbi:MAG: hypothetical protein COB02_01805 [Candidatus Cloacimonadota bacterium]|nr:MAG: hypothetical protein COB02_01805 [Candidatus Cloacimonadota bacterium]